jgi:hypothetical protein
MAIRTLAILAAVISLAACQQPTVWDPPPGGVPDAQFHRDNLECAMIARAAVGDSFAMGTPMFVALAGAAQAQNMKAADRECLLGKGYTLHTQ